MKDHLDDDGAEEEEERSRVKFLEEPLPEADDSSSGEDEEEEAEESDDTEEESVEEETKGSKKRKAHASNGKKTKKAKKHDVSKPTANDFESSGSEEDEIVLEKGDDSKTTGEASAAPATTNTNNTHLSPAAPVKRKPGRPRKNPAPLETLASVATREVSSNHEATTVKLDAIGTTLFNEFLMFTASKYLKRTPPPLPASGTPLTFDQAVFLTEANVLANFFANQLKGARDKFKEEHPSNGDLSSFASTVSSQLFKVWQAEASSAIVEQERSRLLSSHSSTSE